MLIHRSHHIAQQQGVTLVELVISIVIIAVAVTGVMSVMSMTVKHSADPVIHQQMAAIAESYMDEILLQAYSDPNGAQVIEASRSLYDDVPDYDGLADVGAKDQQGNVISGLTEYSVTVAVASVTVVGLAALQVTVTVSVPAMTAMSLVGYKFSP